MKTFVILFAGSLLCVAGCSKKSGNSPSASNANGGSAAGPVDLKIKWQTGKKYDMEMALNQSSDINVPNQPIHQELKLTQDFHYSPLKDLDNGGHQVEMEFDRQNFDLNQNGKELLNFDSTQNTPIDKSSPVGSVASAMRAMLGVPLDYTFAADGTVEKIDGLDSLMSRITAAVPDQRQRVSLGQLYDEDTLKQYGSLTQSLPDHPVSIGDTWSSSHDVNNPTGVMTVDSTYTFKDWEQHNGHNCVHLLISGDVKTKTASAATTGAVVNIKKGTVTGDAWFDPDLGMFVDINSDQDITMDIQTRNMALTQRQKQNVEMSLVDVSP